MAALIVFYLKRPEMTPDDILTLKLALTELQRNTELNTL